MIMKIYAAVTIIMSVIAFATYGIDKQKARNNKWRIPESTLLLLALFGGSIGALAGMKVFRHKTKKIKFLICVPLTLVLWILIGFIFYRSLV